MDSGDRFWDWILGLDIGNGFSNMTYGKVKVHWVEGNDLKEFFLEEFFWFLIYRFLIYISKVSCFGILMALYSIHPDISRLIRRLFQLHISHYDPIILIVSFKLFPTIFSQKAKHSISILIINGMKLPLLNKGIVRHFKRSYNRSSLPMAYR